MWWMRAMWRLMINLTGKGHMLRRYAALTALLFVTLLTGCAGLPDSVKYQPHVTAQKTIPELTVTVTYKADGIYLVQVVNSLPDAVSLQWSNSAYVNTGGDTTRLIHIPNLDRFPDETPAEQLPSPIARGARLKTYFVGESWIDYSRRGVSPRPKDSESKAKIYLLFNIRDKRVYWTGEVTFVPEK
jgi:hypothetical protein